jgi:hypothetical protein
MSKREPDETAGEESRPPVTTDEKGVPLDNPSG